MAVKQFYDDTPIETADVQRWENAASNGTPFYQIDPDVISGATISGTVFYKRNTDATISNSAYSFSAEGYNDGDYCIIAGYTGVLSSVVSLQASTSSYLKLAYVTISNGSFTDFRLVGDGYLKNQISTAEGRAKKYAEDYAKEKDAETLASAQEYADIKVNDAYSDAQGYVDRAVAVVQSQIDEKVNSTFVNEAVSAHDADSNAHGALFGSINSALSGISGGLAAAVEKGNATADTVALLQKYPSYEYSTSGGAVQRFDDVSVIPHNIGVTVHGVTDENGNSVTNPTVSVYGKNLCPINRAENSKVGMLNAVVKKGVTYTFSCLETYTDKGDDPAITTGGQFKINETGTSLGVIWLSKGAKGSFTFVAPEDGTLKLNMYNYVTLEEMQLEVGDTATEYEPYTEPQTANPSITIGEGEVFKVETFNAVSQTMTVIATDDNSLVSTVDIKYNRDVKKALDKLEAAIAAQA